jgi:hypothetical protein
MKLQLATCTVGVSTLHQFGCEVATGMKLQFATFNSCKLSFMSGNEL